MVSLNAAHGQRGGVTSFANRTTSQIDDLQDENLPLIEISERSHQSIPTTWFIIVHIVLTLLFVTAIILFPWRIYPGPGDQSSRNISTIHEGYKIALYIHASFYIVSVGFDRLYAHYQHVTRQAGYLEFYRKTHGVRRIPLFTISTGNAILVCAIILLERYASQLPNWLHSWYFLAVVTVIETLINLTILILYLIMTIRFNKDRMPADAIYDEQLNNAVLISSNANDSTPGNEKLRVKTLQKQGDLILYLRERNDALARTIWEYRQKTDDSSDEFLVRQRR